MVVLNLSRSVSIWFVLLVLSGSFILAAKANLASGSLMPEIELVDKSFSLHAHVTITRKDKSLQYDIREMHSAWQERLVMQYKVTTGSDIVETPELLQAPREGKFYANKNRDSRDVMILLLLAGQGRRACLRKSQEFVDQMFNLGILADDFKSPAPHLIGATRLLAYLNANRDKFRRVSSSEDIKFMSLEPMRSSDGNGDEFTMLVMYRGAAGANLAHGIPRNILVNKQDGSKIVYEFTRYIPIAEHQAHYSHSLGASDTGLLVQQYKLGDQTLVFDLFALERAMGCSRESVLSSNQTTTNTSDYYLPAFLANRISEQRFSFTARFTPAHLGRPMTVLVGYEPALSSLKVERTNSRSSIEILVDYRNNRSFNMLRRVSRDYNSIFDRILQTQNDRLCVVTQASTASSVTNWHLDPPTLGQLLLGTQRLAYLGLARVRGVEARAYEATDCQWPTWYEQPGVYQDESGKKRSKSGRRSSSGPLVGEGVYKQSIPGYRMGPKAGVPVKLNSVFYFSKTSDSSQDTELLDARLLMIEVFTLTQEDDEIIDRMPIHIYDFSWQLNTLAPNNQRWQDFFALGDRCLADPAQAETSSFSVASANSQHVSINLVLENHQKDDEEAKTDTNWLKEPTRRNLALIRSAQEHFLLSNMIYNLESRFPLNGYYGPWLNGNPTTPIHQDSNNQEFMIATLEAAERSRDIARLIYLGAANFVSRSPQKLFAISRTFTMQSCAMYAAHKLADTILAFNAQNSKCFILKDDSLLASKGVKALLEEWFAFDDDCGSGIYEVFRVEHQANVKLTGGDHFSELAQHRDRLVRLDHFVLTDPVSLISQVSDNKSNGTAGNYKSVNNRGDDEPRATTSWPGVLKVVKVSLKIRKFEVNHLEEKSQSNNTETNPPATVEQLVNLSKFPGLGLIEGEHRNRLIVPRRSESVDATGSSLLDQTLNSMTFERCQAACLAELTCNSFSTCTRNGTIECILSEVAFNTPFLAGQLALIVQRRTSKFVTYFPVTLVEHNNNDGNAKAPVDNVMNLRKQITCELHNKQFSELFLEKKKQAISVAQRVYRPVDNLEQCAKLCFEWTLDMLRKRTSAATAVTQSSTSSPTQHGAKLDSNGVCNHFFYVDHIDVIELGRQMQSEQAQRAIDYLLGEQKTGGYCVLDKPLGDQSDEPDAKAITGADAELVGEAQFSVRKYQFDYRFLFEQQFGWSLIESRKTSEELKAYDKLASIWQVSANETEEAIKTMQPFLDRSENSGYWLPLLQIDECARTCFQHSARLWPGCRSFEYIEVFSQKSTFKIEYCAFNSITLKQAVENERFDLVRQGEAQERIKVEPPSTVRVWHFEPKQGLVTGSLDDGYKQILAEDHQYGGSDHRTDESGRSLPLGPFSLFCIISINLLLGLICGIKIAPKILAAKISRARPNDLDSLVDIVERKNDDEQL